MTSLKDKKAVTSWELHQSITKIKKLEDIADERDRMEQERIDEIARSKNYLMNDNLVL